MRSLRRELFHCSVSESNVAFGLFCMNLVMQYDISGTIWYIRDVSGKVMGKNIGIGLNAFPEL